MRRLFIATLLVACSAPESATPTYDTPVDPAELDRFDSKADVAWCDGEGGPQDGTDLLVLVNKANALSARYAPPDLVPLDAPSKGTVRFGAAQALAELQAAALAEHGTEFRVRSGYRSYRTQCRTFTYWVDQKGLEHAERYSAKAGTSQHQLGTTIDLTCDAWDGELEPWVAETPEAAWLFTNATRFGFVLSYPEGGEEATGYAFEPWHYRFVGVEAAAELVETGLILETYLETCEGESSLECPRADMPPRPLLMGFIGSPCATDLDCGLVGEGAHCLLDGHPDGQCTLACERGCPDAPGAASTFCAAERDDAGWCRSKCDFDQFETGCRADYACLDGQRPNNGATADVCLPDATWRRGTLP